MEHTNTKNTRRCNHDGLQRAEENRTEQGAATAHSMRLSVAPGVLRGDCMDPHRIRHGALLAGREERATVQIPPRLCHFTTAASAHSAQCAQDSDRVQSRPGLWDQYLQHVPSRLRQSSHRLHVGKQYCNKTQRLGAQHAEMAKSRVIGG